MVDKKSYAVVNIQGRQTKVFVGEEVKSHLINAEPGTTLSFSEVLMLQREGSVKVGTPLLEGASVTATVVRHARDPKILVFKYLRKNKSKKMRGHRQDFTVLSITGIEG